MNRPPGWCFHVQRLVLRLDMRNVALYWRDEYSPTFWGTRQECNEAMLAYYARKEDQAIVTLSAIPVISVTRNPGA